MRMSRQKWTKVDTPEAGFRPGKEERGWQDAFQSGQQVRRYIRPHRVPQRVAPGGGKSTQRLRVAAGMFSGDSPCLGAMQEARDAGERESSLASRASGV